MKDADLTIERIEPISLALINTLTQTGSLIENFPPSAILYFSSKAEAHFIIAENGIPYLKREFTLSGKGTIEEQILNELRLSFSYYKREFPEKNITKVIICGLKEKPSWLDTVKASLNTPAEYSTPLKVMAEVDVPNPQLEVGLGLAISRLTKQKIDINFLPEEAIPSKINIKAIAISAIAVSVGILALLYLKQIPPVSKLKQQVLTAEAKKIKVEELALSQKSMEELNTLKTTWQQKRDILFTYTKNRMNWHEKLMKLVHVIPKESWITQLTLGDSAAIPGARVFILKGSTYTPDPNMEIEITNNFSNKLKKDEIFMKGFKRLTLGTINKTTIASYEVANFDISLTSD
jgi:Tfp pilus assembly protein PilN